VDFTHNVIVFRDEDEQVWDASHKGWRKGRAEVAMGEQLRDHLLDQRDKALSPYVVEYLGERVKNCQNGWARLCKRAGVEGVTLHTLRHTHATWLYSSNVDTHHIADQLGHANDSITRAVYIKRRAETRVELPRLIEQKLGS